MYCSINIFSFKCGDPKFDTLIQGVLQLRDKQGNYYTIDSMQLHVFDLRGAVHDFSIKGGQMPEYIHECIIKKKFGFVIWFKNLYYIDKEGNTILYFNHDLAITRCNYNKNLEGFKFSDE